MTTGNCKHGTFILGKGCDQCVAERLAGEKPTALIIPDALPGKTLAETADIAREIIAGESAKEERSTIVKVRYHSETTGELSAREYTYYSETRLNVGDIVMVPVRDTTTKTKVSAIDIPESEIASYKDKVKTIPAVSDKPVLPLSALVESEGFGERGFFAEAEALEEVIDEVIAEDRHQFSAPEPLSEEAREVITAGRDTMMSQPIIPTAIIKVGPEIDPDYIALKVEVEKLVLYADKRTVTNKEESELATNDLAFIAKLTKAVEERRVEYVKPLNDYVSQFNLAFKKLSEPLKEAKRITDQQIMSYQRKQAEARRKAEEAQAIANAEALRKAQEIKETTGVIEDIKPEVIDLPPEASTKVRTDFGTASQVDNWKYEIVDRSLVPAEFWVIDETGLGKQVRAGRHDIPGVRIYNEPILRTRA